MGVEARKNRVSELVIKFKTYKSKGKLDLTSEETIRSWINNLLEIFDWDVKDTTQIIQDKLLSKSEIDKLKDIDSQCTKPDYMFMLGKNKLTYLDAKDITVSVYSDKKAAFQIKSYGWSSSAPCAFLTNFEEFAIYDCTYMPEINHDPSLGRIYFTIDEFVSNFEVLDKHLYKPNIYNGDLNKLYSNTLLNNKFIRKVSPDLAFAELLSVFRLNLAKTIVSQNPLIINKDADLLSYVVQIIINRILFVRICEARKVEKFGLLAEFKKSGFWESFKKSSYLEFYDHYDGPLFARDTSINSLIIDGDIFDDLFLYLYEPTPYKFEVIPTKLFSDIYDIFLAKKLVIKNNSVCDELKSEFVKTNGAVSTPDYIVNDIIRRTLDVNELTEKGISKIFDNKIADIACGSGAFLVAAYEFIEKLFIDLYYKNKTKQYKKYFTNYNGQPIINLEGKRAIIDNCVFGVDMDPEAVEVAKMSLSLKIVDSTDYIDNYNEIGVFGSKILSGVGNNIKCGNTLVSSEMLDMYPDIVNYKDELLKTNLFDWESSDGFETVFKNKGGFDYIIGNPPYVEVKNYNVNLPFMHAYIKKVYKSSTNGKVDLAIPFIERAISLVNEKGRIGYVIQKRFFKTDYGKKIREVITSPNLLSTIIDFEATDLFKGRITYVAIVVLDIKKPQEIYYKALCEGPDLLKLYLDKIPLPGQSPEVYEKLPCLALGSAPWNFADPKLLNIKNSLLKNGKLSDYATVKVGIQALWDRAYHIRPSKVYNGNLTGCSAIDEKIEIELAACRPLICNEQFYPFKKIVPNVYVIFPYDIVNGKVKEIPFGVFEKRYPKAGNYLKKHKKLISQNVETYSGKQRWHLFTRANNHGATYPKVVIPMTANDTYAAVCSDVNYYCDNANIYFLEIEDKSQINLYALAGIINSTIFSVLARNVANPQANGYFKFNKQFLEPIPFPVKNFKVDYKGLVSRIAALALRIEGYECEYNKATPHRKRSLQMVLEKDWQNLDEAVYGLYNVSDEMKNIFANKGRNIQRIMAIKVAK